MLIIYFIRVWCCGSQIERKHVPGHDIGATGPVRGLPRVKLISIHILRRRCFRLTNSCAGVSSCQVNDR